MQFEITVTKIAQYERARTRSKKIQKTKTFIFVKLKVIIRNKIYIHITEEEGVVLVVVLQLGVVDGGPGAELRVAAGPE